MAFSSIMFLFVFFPVVIFLNYIIQSKLRNIFLLMASLFFYSWGNIKSMPIFATSIVFNYFFALGIDKTKRKEKLSKFIMIVMLIANVGLLFTFKYLSSSLFFLNNIFNLNLPTPKWSLPLGVSFFTFSAISYCLDVYFQACSAEKNFFNVALYISFFPKLISGPIVKWTTFQAQLSERKFDIDNFSEGVERFIVGLAKKAIIADSIGVFADFVFNRNDFSSISVLLAWFGMFSYLLQLYYDFSGYSDMAIGLGKMLGFELDENFNYPYISKGVVEFWSRWHITLGTWLKHYIYTPVFRALSQKKNLKTGKNLKTKTCDYISLIVSWCIIGPWHGVGLSYLVYGLFFCFFIICERIYENYKKKRAKTGKPLKKNFFTGKILPHIYLVLVAAIGMMIFRSISTKHAIRFGLSLIGLGGNSFFDSADMLYFSQYYRTFIVGIFFSIPALPFLKNKVKEYNRGKAVLSFVKPLALTLLFIVSISYMVTTTYNPFIYFNF